MSKIYLAEFLTILWTYMVGAVTPGADAVVVMRNCTTHGRKAGMLTALGLGCAITLHGLYIMLGLDMLLDMYPGFYEGVRYVGASYLAYLGIRSLCAKSSAQPLPLETDTSQNLTHPPFKASVAWRTGFLTNLLNPFAILYMVSFLSMLVADTTPPSMRIVYAVLLGCAYFIWNVLITIFFTYPLWAHIFVRLSVWIQRGAGLFLVYIALTFVGEDLKRLVAVTV